MSEYFVAGSWRNQAAIEEVLLTLDRLGVSSYSFVRTSYSAEASRLAVPGGADSADLSSAAVQQLFEQDLAALKAADQFLLVLPAGQAAHIEAGIAYGLGKRCLAVGASERSDTLYRIFDRMFQDPKRLEAWLLENRLGR